MTNLTQCIEMVNFWNNKEDSIQKEVVLKYWLKQLKRFTNFKRVIFVEGAKMLTNTTQDKKLAFKTLAKFYGVSTKKKGETVAEQTYRFKCL